MKEKNKLVNSSVQNFEHKIGSTKCCDDLIIGLEHFKERLTAVTNDPLFLQFLHTAGMKGWVIIYIVHFTCIIGIKSKLLNKTEK